MYRFFKDMPKDFNELGKWEIKVYTVFHFKENIAYSETHEGKKGIAYLKVRFRALLKDWETSGNYYGISWDIKKQDEKQKENKIQKEGANKNELLRI